MQRGSKHANEPNRARRREETVQRFLNIAAKRGAAAAADAEMRVFCEERKT
jgi:hypothetical protein